jgi:hypothetical protein
MRNPTVTRLALLFALSMPPLAPAATPGQAEPPEPFVVHYNASYGGFTAESVRSLKRDATTNRYVMVAETSLTLVGLNLTSIHERSEFLWNDNIAQPLLYSFDQTGLGARSRGVTFDQDQRELTWTSDGKSGTLPFSEPVFDELTSFMEIRRQLQEGRQDLEFEVADKAEILTYHYQVVGEETLDTPLGEHRTIHLKRIRDAGSERTTEFWLAPDLDYVLLKLRHMEPDGRLVQLNVRSLESDVAMETAATHDVASGYGSNPDVTATDH